MDTEKEKAAEAEDRIDELTEERFRNAKITQQNDIIILNQEIMKRYMRARRLFVLFDIFAALIAMICSDMTDGHVTLSTFNFGLYIVLTAVLAVVFSVWGAAKYNYNVDMYVNSLFSKK